jgi:hypothetical protein
MAPDDFDGFDAGHGSDLDTGLGGAQMGDGLSGDLGHRSADHGVRFGGYEYWGNGRYYERTPGGSYTGNYYDS